MKEERRKIERRTLQKREERGGGQREKDMRRERENGGRGKVKGDRKEEKKMSEMKDNSQNDKDIILKVDVHVTKII